VGFSTGSVRKALMHVEDGRVACCSREGRPPCRPLSVPEPPEISCDF